MDGWMDWWSRQPVVVGPPQVRGGGARATWPKDQVEGGWVRGWKGDWMEGAAKLLQSDQPRSADEGSRSRGPRTKWCMASMN